MIRLPDDVHKKLDELRNSTGLTFNWLVNRAIKNYLKIKLRNRLIAKE